MPVSFFWLQNCSKRRRHGKKVSQSVIFYTNLKLGLEKKELFSTVPPRAHPLSIRLRRSLSNTSTEYTKDAGGSRDTLKKGTARGGTADGYVVYTCTRDTRSHGSHGQNLTSIPHNTNPTHKRAHALNRATSLEPTETNRFKPIDCLIQTY